MDTYTLLKFIHIMGFVLIFSGVFAIFLSEWQSHTTHDIRVFAEAARYNLIFRNCLIAPGSIIITITGIFLVLELDIGFFDEPWLVGMWGLFAFEFIEANVVARRHNRQTLKCARRALEAGALTPELRREAHGALGIFTHFLDIPITVVMVWCGVARPDGWTGIAIGVAIAVALAVALSMTVPHLYRRTPAPA
jgi:uncharacterized membrane protein